MTIQSDVIAGIRRAFPGAFKEVSMLQNIHGIELICVDMMLKLREYSPYGTDAGITWLDACRQITSVLQTLLQLDSTRIIVAVFDRPDENVAKMLVHQRRDHQEAELPSEAFDHFPQDSEYIPVAWGYHVRNRRWRNTIFLPKVAEYLRNHSSVGKNKVLIVDGPSSVDFVTSNGNAAVANGILEQLQDAQEADWRMISWLALPSFKTLSAAVYSVDGDELAGLFLYYPSSPVNRYLYWIRERRDKEHYGAYEVCDIAILDQQVRQLFLWAQTELQSTGDDPGLEICDYRSIFVSLMLMQGCDFVEKYNQITFVTLFLAYFAHIRLTANFVTATIDSITQWRDIHVDYDSYRFLIHAAYGARYGFGPYKHTCEQVREVGEYRDYPREEIMRCRAARLQYALLYMANSWNPAQKLPSPLEQGPDPLDETQLRSVYGLELVDGTKKASPENVRLAERVIVEHRD